MVKKTYNKKAFIAYGKYCIDHGHRPAGTDPVAVNYYSALAYIRKQGANGVKIPKSLQKTINQWKEYPSAVEKNGFNRTPRIFLAHIDAAITFCETNGHRPALASEIGAKIVQLNSFMRSEKNRKKPTNPKLIAAFEKLRDVFARYPTQAAHNAIIKEEKIKAQIAERTRRQFKTAYRNLVGCVLGEDWLCQIEKLNNGRDINWTIVDAVIRAALYMLGERERNILTQFFDTGDLNEIGHKFGVTRERARQIKERAIRHACTYFYRYNISGIIGTEVASNLTPDETFQLQREYVDKETGVFDRERYDNDFSVNPTLEDYVNMGIIKQVGSENYLHRAAMIADRGAHFRRGFRGLLYSMLDNNFYQYDIGKILQGKVKIYSAVSDIRTLANKSMENAISADGQPKTTPEKLQITQQYSEDFLNLARESQSIVFEVVQDVFVREKHITSKRRETKLDDQSDSDGVPRPQKADEIKPIGAGKYIGLYLPNDTVVLEPNGNFGRSTWVINLNDNTRSLIEELEHNYTIKDRLNNQDAFAIRHLKYNGQYNYDISHIRNIVYAVTQNKAELFNNRNLLLGTNPNMVSNDVFSKIIVDKNR